MIFLLGAINALISEFWRLTHQHISKSRHLASIEMRYVEWSTLNLFEIKWRGRHIQFEFDLLANALWKSGT